MSGILAQRSLDEIRYWSRNLKEHAAILRLGFTIDQPQFVQETEKYHTLFEEFEKKSDEWIHDADQENTFRLQSEFYQSVTHFWSFKRNILELILSSKMVCNHYPLHVDLLSREAVYVMSVMQQLHRGTNDPLPDGMMRGMIFYHRVMVDHTKLLCQMLDPTERELQAEALEFSFQFEQLLLQAVELDTMRPHGKLIPQMERFLRVSTDNVRSLCGFKKQIHQLLLRGKLKSRIHPLLAGHICHEADRFHYLLGDYARSLQENGEIEIHSPERDEPSDSAESSD